MTRTVMDYINITTVHGNADLLHKSTLIIDYLWLFGEKYFLLPLLTEHLSSLAASWESLIKNLPKHFFCTSSTPQKWFLWFYLMTVTNFLQIHKLRWIFIKKKSKIINYFCLITILTYVSSKKSSQFENLKKKSLQSYILKWSLIFKNSSNLKKGSHKNF